MTALATQLVQPSSRPLPSVADDNHDSTDTLVELLESAGCEVRGCYNGGAVLPLAEQFRPDVCILDIAMPGLNGWKVAERLRAWARDRLLLLIALSGYHCQSDVEKSMSAGFDHHIVKPGDIQELFREFSAFVKQMEPAVLALA